MIASAPRQDACPALELRRVSKRFGGVQALKDAALVVRAGEIHGLLGENGSGKSTLIKILAGYHVPDPGAFLAVNGEEVSLPLSPGQFRSLGLSFVHQDLALIPSISVIDNLRISELATRAEWRIAWGRERSRARRDFNSFGIDIDPRAQVADLTAVERALLAIVRAVTDMRAALKEGAALGSGILVLDEPTVFLPRQDIDRLFSLVRQIAAEGSSVLFVSHDLDEVREVTDRVTVLRDGRVHGSVVTAETTDEELVEMIIGRKLHKHTTSQVTKVIGGDAIRLESVAGGTVADCSIEAAKGEVLGLTGLAGSGFEDLPYLLFGVLPGRRGTVKFGDVALTLERTNAVHALRSGIALVPADRQRDGAVPTLSVCDNVSLEVLDQYRSGPFLRRGQMTSGTRKVMLQFDIRPPRPELRYGALSGGNQQKALMAKWLQTKPSLLLLHEPTQGVDVGAREQIFGIIRQSAANGLTVFCASADYEQLAAICDRVLIFARGRVKSELSGPEVTKDRIAEACYTSLGVESRAYPAEGNNGTG